MSRCKPICAKIFSGSKEISKFDKLIAGNTRDRRFTACIRGGKTINYFFPKLCLIVEDKVGNAEACGDRARILDILTCAASSLAMCRFSMVIKLKGDADDVIALILEQGGDHAGVDSARHGDNDTRLLWRLRHRREARGRAHSHWADRTGIWRRRSL